MNFDDATEREPNRFAPLSRFCRIGAQTVYYGGGGSAEQAQPNAYQKISADVADQKWAIHQSHYQPAELKAIERIKELDSDGAKQFVGGQARTQTTAAFGEASEQLSENLMDSGINPNSGAYKTRMASFAGAEGAAAGENQTRAHMDLKDNYFAGLANLSAVGMGESASAQAGLHDLAVAGQNKAKDDAMSAFNDRQMQNYVLGQGLAAVAHHGPGMIKPKGGKGTLAAAPHFANEEFNRTV